MSIIAAELRQEMTELIASRRCLLLGTVDGAGKPCVSYAPFACLEGRLYILISELAQHTRDLLTTAELSVLLIEDETDCVQIFARRRLSLTARAAGLARNDEAWYAGLGALRGRFGELITQLAGLSDFHLFGITPVSGNYVKGFGKAYPLNAEVLAQLDLFRQ